MPSLLVDTDVASFIFKRDSRAALYAADLNGATLLISFMTYAELHRWALQAGWGERRRRAFEAYLRRFVIVPWDEALCHEWAAVTFAADRGGRPIAHADAWQAAIARYLGVPLVSHNRRHFAAVPSLQLISHPS
jgi:tRNA(fMet)-specific endonuclease VapC